MTHASFVGHTVETALARVLHPLTGSQNDSWHLSLGCGHVTFVYRHALPEHVSIVHLLLSLQSAAISAPDLSTRPQPVAALHVGFLQMSLDVQLAPRSSASHDPRPAGLHV